MAHPPDHIERSEIVLLRDRQPEAIEHWFLRNADAVYTFVFYRVGRDEELATDVVQQTFMTALERLEQYDSQRGTMLAWLTTLSRDCIRQALRQAGRFESYCDLWENVDRTLLAAYGKIATMPLPEQAVERAETAELVQMALSSIPGNYQQVLKQRYYQDRPVREIASACGLTEGAVKSLLHRARLAFKAAFQTLAESTHGQSAVRGRVR